MSSMRFVCISRISIFADITVGLWTQPAGELHFWLLAGLSTRIRSTAARLLAVCWTNFTTLFRVQGKRIPTIFFADFIAARIAGLMDANLKACHPRTSTFLFLVTPQSMLHLPESSTTYNLTPIFPRPISPRP
jgi:hypothetical protein